MNGLNLSLLGPFSAFYDDQLIESFRTNKVQALLIYLSAEPGPHTRDMLMELLWPGMPELSARHNLRQTLYRLRSFVPDAADEAIEGEEDTPEPFFLINRQSIELNPESNTEVDIHQFEILIDGVLAHSHFDLFSCPDCRESLEKAVALYRGDFLIDFYLDDSDEFESWAESKRHFYRQKVLDALDLLTTIALGRKEYGPAKGYAEQQLDIDNLRESAYRQLMKTLALAGRREEALAVYDQARRIMAQDLGMAPTKRTTAIYETILAGDLKFEAPFERRIRGYELKKQIGEGAYGRIHRAFQPGVEREVAVKVIRRKFANDPEFIRRFEAEAQTVARLEHPYIVPLYDYWREPDGAYLVMRYFRGGSLLTSLQSGPWSGEKTSSMLDQVAAALDVAHKRGVVHRDIKPANILFDESGNAYLSDFGIAKEVGQESDLTKTGAIIGTPSYISPEQILNDQITPQTDIYSLGAVLYETLTGEKPFPDSSVANLIYKHLQDPLPLVSESRPDLPPQIDEVIRRATAKQPLNRYQNTLELAQDFKIAVHGRSRDQTQPEIIAVVKEIYNPYKGLYAFHEADADDFFGREALIQQLINGLDNDDRFLALVGPSGSGKSSAIKAGLIPALRTGVIPDSKNWFIAEMVPGSHPLEELELALWPVAVDPPPSLVEPMKLDTRGLLRTIRRILPDGADSQLLLVIDQFEELFTLVVDEERRSFFIDSLLLALSAPHSPLRVIITLRADFFDRPLQYEMLGRLLKEHTEVILPLTSEELGWAIREPARRVGVGLEVGLVETIVADVADQPGALPLLQYAMTELFEQRTQNGRVTMPKKAYAAIGGVHGALGRKAEELYSGLDPAGQALAQQLFLRLVTLGEGVEDTRRRVLRSELEGINNQHLTENGKRRTENSQRLMAEIIDLFGEARLLTFDRDPQSRQATVEVAHEALLREWRRLRGWLDENRNDIRIQQTLVRSANEWVQSARENGYLMRGLRLEQIENWAQASVLILTPLEKEYIQASFQQRESEEAKERAQQMREAQLEKKSQKFLRILVIVLAMATFFSTALGLFAFQQRLEALDSANDAKLTALVSGSQAALANNNIDAALALAWQAVEMNPDSAEAQALLSEVVYQPGTVRQFSSDGESLNSVAVSPDEKFMLAASWEGSLIQFDVETGEILNKIKAHELSANDVVISSDGLTAVSGGEDGMVYLWDLNNGEVLRRLADYGSPVVAVAFSPDEKSIIAGGWNEDYPLVRWDLNTGEIIQRYGGMATGMQSAAFTPDGSAILSGSNDGLLLLWNEKTGELIRQMDSQLDETTGTLRHVVISPDGQRAIVGLENSEILLWDLSTGELLQQYDIEGGASAVTYLSSGESVLVGGLTGVMTLLDLTSGEVLKTFVGHNEALTSIVVMKDNQYALSTSIDGTIRLWDLERGQVIRRLAQTGDLTFEVDLSPDGRTALATSLNGSITLYEVESGSVIRQFVDDQPVMAVTFAPDGKTALSGGGYRFAQKIEPGHIILWNLETGQEIRRFDGHPYVVYDVEFSPDGERAVSSGNGAVVIMWDVATGRELWRYNGYFVDSPWPIESYWDVEFSPDGKTVLAAYSKGPIIKLDTVTGREIGLLEGHIDSGATGITFTADGQRAVSSGWDTQAILWDMNSGTDTRRYTNHVGPLGQIDFMPGADLMLGGSGDGTASLWNVQSGEVMRRYGGGFVMQSIFNEDGSKALVGFLDGAVEVWRVDKTLEELLAWTLSNRFIPELTCQQRELFDIEPLCAADG